MLPCLHHHTELAKENGDDTRIMPSGNASDPYISKRIRDTTYDEQIDQVAVALIARIPLEGDLYQNVDNIQLEMVCVKAERLDGPDESNRSNGSGGSDSQQDNAARPAFVSATLVISAAAVFVGLVL